MNYAYVEDNEAKRVRARRPQRGWVVTSLDPPEGRWEPITSDVEAAGFGWYTVVENPRPADTSDTTHDRSWTLQGIQWVETWTPRPKTADELARDVKRAESQARTSELRNAVTTLRTWSDQAAGANVTQANAIATLQATVRNLGVFYDQFADLLVEQYGDD